MKKPKTNIIIIEPDLYLNQALMRYARYLMRKSRPDWDAHFHSYLKIEEGLKGIDGDTDMVLVDTSFQQKKQEGITSLHEEVRLRNDKTLLLEVALPTLLPSAILMGLKNVRSTFQHASVA